MMTHLKSGFLDSRSLNQQAEIFQAAGNPIRIAIIRVLAESDLCVSDLVDRLKNLGNIGSVERTNISKHLAVLRDHGVVSVSGDAQRRVYHLSACCLVDALDCVLAGDCIPKIQRKRGD
jgi:ArsR family transcriptional regulator